jgi:hypothetical protein
MLILPASVRLFLARDPVDMRKGFDSLATITRQQRDDQPRAGVVEVARRPASQGGTMERCHLRRSRSSPGSWTLESSERWPRRR